MKKKILGTGLVLSLMLSGVSGMAMKMEQLEGKTVRISGNTGNAGEMVALDVYTGGKSRQDLLELTPQEYLNCIVARMQTETDDAGDYSFEFDIDLPNSKYVAYAGTENEEFEPYNFVYVSDEAFVNMAEEINDADVLRIKEILEDENECYVIGLDEAETAAVDTDDLAKIIYNTLKDTGFIASDRNASWEIIDKAYFVAKLNEGQIENIFDESEILAGFEESEIADWYEKSFVTDSFKEEFTERMSNAGAESYNEYLEALPESFVLTTVKYPDGVGNIKEVVKEFQEEIGINVTSSTPDKVWNKLAGKDYDSYDELKDAFNEYKKSSNTSGSGGGSGSGGSKVSQTAGVAGTIVVPPADAPSVAPPVTPSEPEVFEDIENVAWAKEAILALAEKGIVNGVDNKTFAPNANVTREQFAKIVVGAFTPDAKEADVEFIDVVPGAWYESYIKKAYSEGIIKGMGDGIFGVDKNVTRQDMCVMIYNAAKAAGVEFSTDAKEFADDEKIADYAKEAVYALKNAGAVSGMTATEFAPLDGATRAQAAKIIYSLIK